MSNETENGAPEGMPTFLNCPDWGKGGRYVYDPVTNTRTRVDDDGVPVAEETAAVPAPAETNDAEAPQAAATVKPAKEKSRA